MDREIKFGKVKRYFAKRGFGFITPDDGGPDVFFHITRCRLPFESEAGMLGLRRDEPDEDLPDPNPGNWVAYYVAEFRGEAQAVWTPIPLWRVARAIIAKRKNPHDPKVRVIANNETIWEGWESEFYGKLEKQDFPEILASPNAVRVEIEMAHGWDDVAVYNWHPAYRACVGVAIC